ncbi:MAG TPA: spore germination protein [Bacillota bacterium]|nr:spore germination protein [Bacillota bacterium]
MGFLDYIKKAVILKKPEKGNTFVLPENPHENPGKENGVSDEARQGTDSRKTGSIQNEEKQGKPNLQKARIIKRKKKGPRPDTLNKTKPVNSESSAKDMVDGVDYKERSMSTNIHNNLKIIKEIFNYPENGDLIFREFKVKIGTFHRVTAVFINGLVDKAAIHNTVIYPLMQYSGEGDEKGDVIDYIMKKVVPSDLVVKGQTYGQVVDGILEGKTAIFVGNSRQALLIDTSGWRTRNVEQPVSEKTVKGPQAAFNEDFMTNISLIRRSLPSHNLMNEIVYIGSEQKNTCSVIYLKNIANPSLVKEVKRRLNSIKTDYLPDGGGLEQLIEDHPYMLVPQVINTERPDMVVSSLLQGKVAIVLSNSPNVLIVPVTFWEFIQSPEDRYLRSGFGTLLVMLRYLALTTTLFLPAFYIAIINFHQEMIPTDLLFSFAGARERVPFPTIVEVLIMEVSFELIREAGIRIPGLIGPTLGIIGALILGQAAVAAIIVSPVVIIIVALTGIGSFALPNYSFSFAARTARFINILLASVLGLFGIAFSVFIALAALSGMRSFGVPYLAPVAPPTKSAKSAVTSFPLWNEERTPDYLNTIKTERQPEISRGWVNSKPEGKRE